MRTSKLNKLFLTIAVVACISLAGCKDWDEDNGKESPKLALGSETVAFEGTPTGAKTVNITSNVDWSVSVQPSSAWLIVATVNGSGNGVLQR